MSEAFDPYHKWLGIPPEEQPPHHYRLLGIKLFEDDEDVIVTAADARMMHLKSFQAGQHSAFSQRLLNEIAAAKVCLLSPEKRAAYDSALRARLSPTGPVPVAPVPKASQVPPVSNQAAPLPDIPKVSIAGGVTRRRRRGRPWGILLGGAGILLVIGVVLFLNRHGEDWIARTEAPATAPKRTNPPPSKDPAKNTSKPVSSEEARDDSEPLPELLRNGRLLGDLLDSPDIDPQKPEKDARPETSPATEPELPPEDVPGPDKETLPQEKPPKEAPRGDGKLSVPSENEQKAVRSRIHDLFRDELLGAREPGEKSDLASKMFAQGAKTKDDPTLRFVFIDWAGSLAAEAGALDKTLAAVDILGQEYQVAVLSKKAEKLSELIGALRGEGRLTEIQVPLIDTTTRLAEAAVQEDDFETATRLAKLAQRVARASKSGPLIRQTTTRMRELDRLAARHRAAGQSLEILAQDPANGEANLTVGQWYCFAKRDWSKGLPYLAKGADASLADLAQRDLRHPSDPKEQASLADAWWDRLEKEDRLAQEAIQLRARYWYAAAASKASGLEKVRLQKRLREITKTLETASTEDQPSAPAAGALSVGQWVKLLEQIHPQNDCLAGKAERKEGAIVIVPSKPGTRATVLLPVVVDGSYELRFECLGLGTKMGAIHLLLPVGNTACSAHFGFGGNSGISRINGKTVNQNPSTRKTALRAGIPYTMMIRVQIQNQDATLTAMLNGMPLLQWSGPQQALSLGSIAMKNRHRLEIGNWDYPVAFSNLQFRLLSGKAVLVGASH